MSGLSNVTDLAAARQARAERLEAVVRVDPDPNAQARCAMPGCGKPLYIEHTDSSAIMLGWTAEDLAAPGGDYETWAVVCERGHKVLLPAGDGMEGGLFGDCHCDGEPELLADCGHNDMARLRRVVA